MLDNLEHQDDQVKVERRDHLVKMVHQVLQGILAYPVLLALTEMTGYLEIPVQKVSKVRLGTASPDEEGKRAHQVRSAVKQWNAKPERDQYPEQSHFAMVQNCIIF